MSRGVDNATKAALKKDFQLKELNLKPSFDEQIDELYKDVENFIDDYLGEISTNTTQDAVPDGGYVPKGKVRKYLFIA